ncbi:MAG TPA: DUF5680 domain-containing protein [Anaerolineales bacterium]|nr:DUF5680 domain-containing protein [Anaerolineales bacterium]
MDFVSFLLKAKLKTYSSGGEGNERSLEDGTREMSYQEGHFHYRDRHFGFNPFVGEEVVWENGKVIWAMNYYGMVTDESVSPGDVYRFLQKAMQNITAERPFRGPHEYREGDYLYQDSSEGDVSQFSGEETIFFQHKQVYLLTYHGGKVR